MRMRPLRNSVMGTWLISYIFVLVLPVVILAGSMFRFVRTLDNEISYSSAIVLEQIQLKMDTAVDRFNTICADIGIDPNIRRLLGLRSRYDIPPYEIYQTVTSFRRLVSTKERVGDLLIYFAGCDLVLNQSTYQHPGSYYDIYLRESGIPKETWLDLIGQKHTAPQYYRLRYEQGGNPVDRIVVVRPLMLEMHTGLYANIVLFMDDTSFMRQDFTSLKRETILILDNRDQILYNSSGFPLEPGVMQYGMANAPTDMRMSGRDVIVSQIASRSANWKYIIIVEKSSYLAPVDRIKRQVAVSVALCLLVGGALIGYALLRNYRPLRGILSSLQRELPREDKGNEYQVIANAIGELQHETRSVRDMLEQQKTVLREQTVLGLLENYKSVSPEEQARKLREYGVLFQSDSFLVLLYLVRPGDGPFMAGNAMLSEAERQSLSHLILRNVMSELLGEAGMLAYPFRTGQLLGFLLNPKEKQDAFPLVSKALAASAEVFDTNFQIDYLCACSDLCHSASDLPLAYAKALEVMEYKTTLDLDDVVFYRDITNIDEKGLAYPPGFEAKLVNAVKIGDAPRAFETIRDAVSLNRERRCPPELMRYLMVNIAGTVIRAVSEMDEKTSRRMPELSFQTVMRCGSISEMHAEIERIAQSVCDVVRERMQAESAEPSKALYEKCVAYVSRHYADESISVAKIAEETGVHVVHLSRVFKEYSGESLSVYINLARIEKAKELILTGMKLEQVAGDVGFGSLRTFMRVFKKHEGITPGQYKESMGRMEVVG